MPAQRGVASMDKVKLDLPIMSSMLSNGRILLQGRCLGTGSGYRLSWLAMRKFVQRYWLSSPQARVSVNLVAAAGSRSLYLVGFPAGKLFNYFFVLPFNFFKLSHDFILLTSCQAVEDPQHRPLPRR